MSLSDYVKPFYDCSLRQPDYEYSTVFFIILICSRETVDIFPHLKSTSVLAFSQTLLKEVLSNFVWLLGLYQFIPDLEFVPRLQVCQHNLQVVFLKVMPSVVVTSVVCFHLLCMLP